jgi:hypothetical protein
MSEKIVVFVSLLDIYVDHRSLSTFTVRTIGVVIHFEIPRLTTITSVTEEDLTALHVSVEYIILFRQLSYNFLGIKRQTDCKYAPVANLLE